MLLIYSESKECANINFAEDELGINKNTMIDFNNYVREISLLFEH